MEKLKTHTFYNLINGEEININIPTFNIPSNFESSNEYLKYLAFEGAHLRYGQLLDKIIIERLNRELKIIEEMGLSDYFLIVADYVRYAREQGAMIDADISLSSSSIVVYCLGITSIDPIKYGLLFERYIYAGDNSYLHCIVVNIDFFHKEMVLRYVSDKYGDSNLLQLFKWDEKWLFSRIHRAVVNIKKSRGIDLDVYAIPLDDRNTLKSLLPDIVKTKTFDMWLFVDTTEYESNYCNQSFFERLRQREFKNYHSIPQIAEYLAETKGFIIFQEQVMWLSQLLAGFTPEESNKLRIALGEKHCEKLNLFKAKFMEQTTKRGYEKTAMENLWNEFNSSIILSKTVMLGSSLLWYRATYLVNYYPT